MAIFGSENVNDSSELVIHTYFWNTDRVFEPNREQLENESKGSKVVVLNEKLDLFS